MRIGIGSWTYGWAAGVRGFAPPAKPLTAIELLRRAGDFGLGVVQIADNMPVHNLSGGELEELSACAARRNIEIELGTAGVQPGNLLRYLDLAQRLGARLVRSLLADIDGRPDTARPREWIEQVLPRFESAGVCLALENYERHTAGELAGMVRAIASPALGVCLDTVNSLGALETPAMVVPQLAPFVRSLHVKDFAIERVASRMGFAVEGRPAGEGILNLDWLLGELRAAGAAPNLILELWTPYQGSVEASIRLEEEWAARSVRFLKRYADAETSGSAG